MAPSVLQKKDKNTNERFDESISLEASSYVAELEQEKDLRRDYSAAKLTVAVPTAVILAVRQREYNPGRWVRKQTAATTRIIDSDRLEVVKVVISHDSAEFK
ncbi:hypothetical protein NDU88_003036 [Pleurodeles waltl]|uniref:Uncharacterized protein n=1 Tax=Pleurodeles waltl TaxID=8319 RepID=A0AAV7WR74_PLEWA|nr:hypothetical protein NDU88_003036 [Pleurodeles waltl]